MTFIRFGNLFSLSLFLFFSFLSSRAPLQVAPLICCRHGQLSRRGRSRPPGSLEALIRSFLLRGKACLLRRPFGGAAQGVRVMFSLARSFPRPQTDACSRLAYGRRGGSPSGVHEGANLVHTARNTALQAAKASEGAAVRNEAAVGRRGRSNEVTGNTRHIPGAQS